MNLFNLCVFGKVGVGRWRGGSRACAAQRGRWGACALCVCTGSPNDDMQPSSVTHTRCARPDPWPVVNLARTAAVPAA
jgi:hypothetical protein